MGEYRIIGGNPIKGEMRIGGGKNAVLPILAATVLNSGVSILRNCPRIADTHTAVAILEALGCRVVFDGNEITADTSKINSTVVPEALVQKMRAAIIFMGSMLARFGAVRINYPGGCALGARPIDLHLKALRQMGAVITEAHGFIDCKAEQLRGTRIHLDFPSVGATENIMLAAALADGETIIENAAREPEIADLQSFLNGMGADVHGAGEGAIVVRGVKALHDVAHTVMPDRIIAGTMLVAAAITKGEIVLDDVVPEHLTPITAKLAETGCTIRAYDRQIALRAPAVIQPIDCLRTLPHPGFPTDMQAQMMAYLTRAQGASVCVETIFESRNKHVAELKRMGADIILAPDGQTAVIKGAARLHGTTVEAGDLRGGAALILAGLAADGQTIVRQSEYVERGYEKIDQMLQAVGADVCFADSSATIAV